MHSIDDLLPHAPLHYAPTGDIYLKLNPHICTCPKQNTDQWQRKGGAEGASAPLPNYEKRGAEPLQISYYIIQVRLMSRSWDNVDSMHDQLLTVQP